MLYYNIYNFHFSKLVVTSLTLFPQKNSSGAVKMLVVSLFVMYV